MVMCVVRLPRERESPVVFPNLIDHKECLTGLGPHRTHSLAFSDLRKHFLEHPLWEAPHFLIHFI